MKDRAPTRDELLAQAFADGELEPAERLDFERRMSLEPALAKEVAALQALDLVARQCAPAEPMDHEWRKLEGETLHQLGHRGGFGFAILGALGLFLLASINLWKSDAALEFKVLTTCLVGGLLAIFLTVLRGRLRTLPYDPYTKVKR